MTTLREAAQQALEALEEINLLSIGENAICLPAEIDDAMDALRAALAEPVQEPVAWAVYDIKHGGSKTLHWPEQHSPNGDPSQFKAVPLYPAPPQRKPLTDEEIRGFYYEHAKYQEAGARVSGWWEFARAVERAHGITGDKHGS